MVASAGRHPALAVLRGDPQARGESSATPRGAKASALLLAAAAAASGILSTRTKSSHAKVIKDSGARRSPAPAAPRRIRRRVFCQHVSEPVLGVRVGLHAHLRRLECRGARRRRSSLRMAHPQATVPPSRLGARAGVDRARGAAALTQNLVTWQQGQGAIVARGRNVVPWDRDIARPMLPRPIVCA